MPCSLSPFSQGSETDEPYWNSDFSFSDYGGFRRLSSFSRKPFWTNCLTDISTGHETACEPVQHFGTRAQQNITGTLTHFELNHITKPHHPKSAG